MRCTQEPNTLCKTSQLLAWKESKDQSEMLSAQVNNSNNFKNTSSAKLSNFSYFSSTSIMKVCIYHTQNSKLTPQEITTEQQLNNFAHGLHAHKKKNRIIEMDLYISVCIHKCTINYHFIMPTRAIFFQVTAGLLSQLHQVFIHLTKEK